MREIKFRTFLQGIGFKYFELGEPFAFAISSKNGAEQFTGLKDVNGVDIYEGDIIENKGQFIGAVRFLDGYFYVTSWIDYKFKDVTESKIIGNIHENPELLGWGDL